MKPTPPAYPAAASVKFLTELPLGLYLHVPFCKRKCAYCDFYSSFATEELLDKYTESLINAIKQWGGNICRPTDTIYLGGGTPSLLGKRLGAVIGAVKTAFNVAPNAEITLEINPSGDSEETLAYALKAGVNRLSVGVQSGNDGELALLGRTHTAKDAEKTIAEAKALGFKNISVDLMLGLPRSDTDTLKDSIDFCISLEPQHISAYILKVEDNTYFAKLGSSLCLPDADKCADQYLFLCDELCKKGFEHYEISNFCRKGYESRHNLKYWHCEEYLGLGPAAHSFLNGKRFYYPRDLKGFMNGNAPLPDGDGGGREEFIMLNLRTNTGIEFEKYRRLFGDLPDGITKAAKRFAAAGLINITNRGISLTDRGMLVSNSIITDFLEEI